MALPIDWLLVRCIGSHQALVLLEATSMQGPEPTIRQSLTLTTFLNWLDTTTESNHMR